MATTADVISQTSSINSITKSISSTRSSLSSTNSSIGRIQKIVETKTKVRNDLFFKNQIIERRRREASKRREYEDQIEASRVTTNFQSGLRVASSSSQGPLSRILSFLGYMGAGWIIENLPTWIGMGQEFIGRMKRAGQIIYSIPQTMWRILQGFGDVLKSVGTNIRNLDFTDSSDEVKNSFSQLTDTIDLLGIQIVDGFKLMLQPTGEVDIPSTGEQQPDTGFPEVPAPSPGSGGGGGRWKPLLDLIHSVESSTDKKNNGYDAQNGAPGGVRPGLSQMTIGEIARNAPGASGRYQQMPQFLLGRAKAAGFNEKTIFSAAVQDTLAIKLIEGRGGNSWLSGKMKTEDFMQGLADEWAAIPNAYGQFSYPGQSSSLRSEKVKSVLNQVKQETSQTPTAPPKPTVTPQTPTAPPPPKPPSVGSGKIYQYFHGEPGRAGYDPTGHSDHDHFSFTTRAAAVKAFLALKQKGFQPYEFEGYGRKMPSDSHSPSGGHFGPAGGKPTYNNESDGTAFDIPYSSYGSGPIGEQDYKKSREAYKIVTSAIGQSASSEQASAASISPQNSKVPKEQQLQPTKTPEEQPQISSLTPETQARIAEAVSQERMGQQILFIDDRSASQPATGTVSQKSYGGGSSGQITEFDMLNRFMKQKLLLDFNYL